MPVILLKDIHMEAMPHLEMLLQLQKRFLQNQQKLMNLKTLQKEIPKSSVSFNMIAIPGGKFQNGKSC